MQHLKVNATFRVRRKCKIQACRDWHFNPSVWFNMCIFIAFIFVCCAFLFRIQQKRKKTLFKIAKSAVLRIIFLTLIGILYGYSLRYKFLEVTNLKTHISKPVNWAGHQCHKQNKILIRTTSRVSSYGKVYFQKLVTFHFTDLGSVHCGAATIEQDA